MSLMKPAEATQRLGVGVAIVPLLESYGVDSAGFLSEFGLTRADLDGEARVPFSLAAAILAQAAVVSGRPHICLELGIRYDHRTLGQVGALMAAAPTLESALRDYVRYQVGYSKAAAVYLCYLGEDAALGYGVYRRTAEAGRQLYDLCMALACNMLTALTNGVVRPTEIHFNTAAPADITPYKQLLPAPVLFDQGHSCVLFKQSDLKTPLPTRDPVEHARLKALLDSTLREDLNDVVARVRQAMRPALLSGRCGVEAIAAELAMHPRTLSRRLAGAGVTFEALRDEVRFSVACELLDLTDLPVGAVGDALSYASHSVFVHAFRRWTGASPSEWRRNQRSRA